MNLTELIEGVRDRVSDNPQQVSAPKKWSDSFIVRRLNEAHESMWLRALEADEHWGIDAYTLSDVGGIVAPAANGLIGVFLPTEIGNIKFISEGANATDRGVEVFYRNFSDITEFLQAETLSVDSVRAWFNGPTENGLYFTNVSAIDPAKITVWFCRRPPAFVRFTCSSYPTTAQLAVNFLTAASLGKLQTSKDYYKNSSFECLTTIGSVTPVGQRFLAAGWAIGVHPTYNMSLATVHGLAAGASTWESVPIWPSEFHPLLSSIAAYKCLLKASERDQREAILQEMQPMLSQFASKIEARQLQWGRYVHYMDD